MDLAGAPDAPKEQDSQDRELASEKDQKEQRWIPLHVDADADEQVGESVTSSTKEMEARCADQRGRDVEALGYIEGAER